MERNQTFTLRHGLSLGARIRTSTKEDRRSAPLRTRSGFACVLRARGVQGLLLQVGNCQNYGPFLGPYYNTGPNLGNSKRDHNFDNPPSEIAEHPSAEMLPGASRNGVLDSIGIMEKKMELTIEYWDSIGIMEKKMALNYRAFSAAEKWQHLASARE